MFILQKIRVIIIVVLGITTGIALGDESPFPELCRALNFNVSEPGSFYFIHISDTHIGYAEEGWSSSDNFRGFITGIESLDPKPAFVIITGDCVENGTAEEWEEFYKLVQEFEQRLPKVPFHIGFGNHDIHVKNFLKLSPKRKLYYSFDMGGIRFISLFCHRDSELMHEEVFFGLSLEQLKWLKNEVKSYSGETLVIFVHQPPISGDFSVTELISDIQSAVSVANPKTKVWIFSGHWHRTEEFQILDMKKDDVVYSVQTEALAGRGTYRVIFVQDGKITNTVLKNSKEKSFVVSPSPDSWLVATPIFYGHKYPILLFADLPEDDEKYLVEDKGCNKTWMAHKDLEEKDAFMIYKVPVVSGTAHFGFYANNEYWVEVSSDGRNWQELVKSPKGFLHRPQQGPYEWKLFIDFECFKVLVPLPKNLLKERELFIRFQDPYPGNSYSYGAEAAIEWFALVGSKK